MTLHQRRDTIERTKGDRVVVESIDDTRNYNVSSCYIDWSIINNLLVVLLFTGVTSCSKRVIRFYQIVNKRDIELKVQTNVVDRFERISRFTVCQALFNKGQPRRHLCSVDGFDITDVDRLVSRGFVVIERLRRNRTRKRQWSW